MTKQPFRLPPPTPVPDHALRAAIAVGIQFGSSLEQAIAQHPDLLPGYLAGDVALVLTKDGGLDAYERGTPEARALGLGPRRANRAHPTETARRSPSRPRRRGRR